MLENFSRRFHKGYRHLESIEQIKRLSPKEVLAKTERVRKSFIGIPIYMGLNSYPYSPFELTADVPFHASLFEDAAALIIHNDPENFENADIILSEGDRGGGPLAEEIGRMTGIPIVLANWHKEIPVDLPNVIVVETKIGFSGNGYIVVSGLRPGQKVILVDDLLSSGGTSEALIKAIEGAGATIVRAFFAGEKVNKKGREYLKQQFPDVEVTSLVRFVSEGKFTREADI